MSILLLTGLPGSGKTHARRELERRMTSAQSIDCAAIALAVHHYETRRWTPETFASFEEDRSPSVTAAVMRQCEQDETIIEATPIFALALTRALRGGVLLLCRVDEPVREERLRERFASSAENPLEIAQFHRIAYQPALFALERLPRLWRREEER